MKSRPPGSGGSKKRDRYERVIKKLFRIRDQSAELGTPTQSTLPLEKKSE
jgi:hypothetical protein